MDFVDCVNFEVDGEINEFDEFDLGIFYELLCKNLIGYIVIFGNYYMCFCNIKENG